MTGRRGLRTSLKVLHELASIGYGGALAACLVINQVADPRHAPGFAAARLAFEAIARYLLVPSMAVVVVSGLIALAATRGYQSAGWAWLKALLGLSVFEATVLVVASGQTQAQLVAAIADPARLDTLLRSERNTLWLLIVVSVVNVVLAVWRPKLMVKVR